MQETSATWKQLWAAGAAVEARATIGGAVYTDIGAPVINRAAMQEALSIGNVVSASLELTVRGAGSIPRSAAVVIEARLNDGATASEWLPQGTFYISRRARDPVTGVLALECYDALLKANAVWTPSAGDWPRTMAAVAAELVALLGVTLDSRTAIPSGPAFMVGEPAIGTSVRDALSLIAHAAGGNWIMTPGNRLRLVALDEAGDALEVAGVVGGMDVGAAGSITGVRCTVDGVAAMIGDDTGIVVDAAIAPMIAADMAQRLIGLPYQPFNLAGAIYDPAAELGDSVLAGASGEIASVLYSEQVALGPAVRGIISAPEAGELTDEYPYIGSDDRALALARAAVSQAVDRLDDTLTQQEIFNRLTDNGAAQGLVLYNGQLYVNATYVNTGELAVQRINLNAPEDNYSFPDENDPDSLFTGQSVSDGWIVQPGHNGITVLKCDYAKLLRGKALVITAAIRSTLYGGNYTLVRWDTDASKVEEEGIWTTHGSPSPYTFTFTVPEDCDSFSIDFGTDGVKQIQVSVATVITYPENMAIDYKGLHIGDFEVDRDGNLETWGLSQFVGATRFAGYVYFNWPEQARANLGITPANIGAVSTSDVIDEQHGGTGVTELDTSGTINLSNGTVKWYKSLHTCTVVMSISGMTASGWQTVCTGLPGAADNMYFAIYGSSGPCSAYIHTNGTLRFNGQGTQTVTAYSFTYVTKQ